MKLTRHQWKQANSVLKQSMGFRNADILVPAMLNTLNIKHTINEDFYARIDESHLCDGEISKIKKAYTECLEFASKPVRRKGYKEFWLGQAQGFRRCLNILGHQWLEDE